MKNTAPKLTTEQIDRRNKILNSNNPNFYGYGHKLSDIERITRTIHKKYECSYEDALSICKSFVSSNIHEEKFSGIFFLNHFKSNFNQTTINFFEFQLLNYCDTWAFCDSFCIRIIGPFLGKKNNQQLAEKTIDKWSNSENLWVRRASLVILLKIVMIKREFNEEYVFKIIEKMLKYPEDYIQKGVGWLFKTCSKFNPDSIFLYLMSNKKRLPHLILRYASEKLPEEKKVKVLKK
ncbi:MAG: DNA alkylation repair protein [Candidatus Lokiarchaeota archaeon]|nr:DNA alkylation repair protein [Candidatus Lokiarchaeota archaeon]